MTQPAIRRITIAISLTLAVVLIIPAQHVVAGMTSARAGSTSNLGAEASLHRMSNGKIAFFDYDTGDPHLEVLNPDGTGQKQLTRSCPPGPHREGCVIEEYAWSPQGTRLAFFQGYPHVNRPSITSLFVVNADGSGEKRLVRCGQWGCDQSYGSGLSWSPDGSRIVFAHRWSLYVMNANSGGLRRLTHCTVTFTHSASGAITGWTKKSCLDTNPAWSPDGSRIAFVRMGRTGSGLHVVNPDGTGLTRLAPRLGSASDPAWSPDGRKIAFDTAGRADAIYTVNGDGSHLRLRVSGPPGSGPGLPSWSPDGTRIVYANTPRDAGHFRLEVWVMNANGTGRWRLYHSACCTGGPGYPIWSPDGKYIAFDADINLHPQSRPSGIYLMDADGRHLRRLTQFSSVIAWQPIP